MAKFYVPPFALYLLGASVCGWWPTWYALAYPMMVVLVGVITFRLLRGQGLVRPHGRVGHAVLVGLIGIALWIGLSELRLEERIAGYLPEPLQPQPRVGFNPFETLNTAWRAWGFLAFRFFGLVVLVPVAEELFWRGFLWRWLISADWERVPLGRFHPVSFAAVTLLFTLAHPEWLAAAVYCALLNGLMCWKKDLWDCIVAHSVSNLVLGLYVLATGSWWLW